LRLRYVIRNKRTHLMRFLGEQPERDDAKDDTEEHTIVALKPLGLAAY